MNKESLTISAENPFLNAQKQLENVARYLNISPDTLEVLKQPQAVIEVNIPVKLDSGRTKVFKGYRSQHNNALGPYKGGIRFHPGVNKEEVMALSMWMTWKCSVPGIPFGGGKGGVVVDPKTLSETELERLSRGYVRAVANVIGACIDVPAPDVGTNGKIMEWMRDEYQKIKCPQGVACPVNEILATFTGKPVETGGSLGRKEATGRGGVYVLQALLEKLNPKSEIRNTKPRIAQRCCLRGKQIQNPNDKKLKQNFEFRASNLEFPQSVRIAVQGIGNVGYWFARIAQEAGFEIVAVSDSRGGIVKPAFVESDSTAAGKDIGEVGEIGRYKEKTGSVVGFPGTKTITNEELLELEVDVLVPAALESVITEKNADKIKAKIIIEMANGPITPGADEILNKKGIIVVPDILANSGGVTVSSFEWEQNLKKERWPAFTEVSAGKEVIGVNERLKGKIVKAFGNIWEIAEEKKVDLRKAAYIMAVDRVVKAM